MLSVERIVWAIAAALALLCGAPARATDFGSPGAAPAANVDEVLRVLHEDRYDLELLISYGTSKGGSAGHLALAIRDPAGGDDRVYTANFYADRDPEHAQGFYTDDLMLEVPKAEYLYGTTSSLGDKASFGLDFGEIYKRSVVGVRVFGVPGTEKQSLVAFFARVNADYHRHAKYTDYHGGEVKYGYLGLNCAKSIGMAFKVGAGYDDLEVNDLSQLLGLRVVGALAANIPTEMAMKLLQKWHARGYGLDMVLYRKYRGSNWTDPHDEDAVPFKDLPNRFPSVLSRDFLEEQDHYKDVDNLFAMYLLYNLGKYSVRIDDASRLLQIDVRKEPMRYAAAAELAMQSARGDSEGFRSDQTFQPRGTPVGEVPPNKPAHEVGEPASEATP